MLDQEYKYWLENKEVLTERYHRRYIVIKGLEVIGDYAKSSIAYRETLKAHKPDSFLVKYCKDDEFTDIHNSLDHRGWSWVDLR